MNWKNRLTNYNFWISIFSAVLLILQALKIEFDIAYVNEIFTAVLGLLVVIGIISDPTRTTVKSAENTTPSTAATIVDSKTKPAEKSNQPLVDEKVENGVNALPIEQENEINNVNNENDLQTFLTKITTSIDEKMKELAQFNLETFNKLNQTQIEFVSDVENNSVSSSEEKTSSVASPAVAEISNPFVDVIN